MKKIFLILLVFILNFTLVSADSNYSNDYTLIDCINGNNSTWVPFDSSKPYSTLKEWIEKTINYINSNVNYNWNEINSAWKIFNIKVTCSFQDILNPNINLNFLGTNYDNELIIEWIWNNSLVFKDMSIDLSYNAWNVTFKNAIFLNEKKPYFNDYLFMDISRNYSIPFSNWIKIINSNIKLNNSNNIWLLWTYRTVKYINRNWNIDYYYYWNYTNKQIIENSTIDIEVSNDYVFRLPVLIKNSKINFVNSWSTNPYIITFQEEWNVNINTHLNYSVLVSNIIDLWWNNLSIENSENITFINNKIINFSLIDLLWDSLYINNYFDTNNVIDVTSIHNLFNNVFKSWFIDDYDKKNVRKNYSSSNLENKWLGWIYKRIRTNKYFNIDINSAWLYKEVTWLEFEKWLWEIYVIFNY